MKHVPYFSPTIGEEEINNVSEVLRSGWLTTGPKSDEFERLFREWKDADFAIAVNSCTSGLFLAMHCLDLEPGDEVITTPLTFAATVNVIVHNGGKPVFADIDPNTLTIDPDEIRKKITDRTKAIVVMHMGGNPCKMDEIMKLADGQGIVVIEDCAHAIDGKFGGQSLGTFGRMSSFSFYPNKNVTAGEGGIVLTKDAALAQRLKALRQQGFISSSWELEQAKLPEYDIPEPGFKMNLPDIQAAIAIAQMKHLQEWQQRRREIRRQYETHLKDVEGIRLVKDQPGGEHGLHLFTILVDPEVSGMSRDELILKLKASGVGVSVTYKPVHLFSWYREKLGYHAGDFPHAEAAGASIISLPFYPSLSGEDQLWVIEQLKSLF